MSMSESMTSTTKRPRSRSIVVDPPVAVNQGRDRRKHDRHPLDRPAKLFCPRSGRFLAARTVNISAGGVLVEVDAPEAIEAGDPVQMTIAFGDRFIVPMSELVACSVVRASSTASPERLSLAIAYDDATETALAA